MPLPLSGQGLCRDSDIKYVSVYQPSVKLFQSIKFFNPMLSSEELK